MKAPHQRILMILVVIFVMTLSLFNTGIAFADDQPPVEPAVTEEPVVIDTPSVTEEPVAIEISETAPESTSTAEITEEKASVQEIFEQIPAETDIVALNEEGQPEPLATQQAAEIILTSDPMWCPTGQTPGDAGCTAGYATAAQLISALNGITGDGTIYFTSTYSTNDLTFDQTNANLAGLGALTIQGGWNGSTGNAFALSGSTTFDGVGLSIINWTSAVTINDINVIGNTAGDGLQVISYADITLENITANTNGGDGVYLNNCNGVGFSCNGSGDITISGTNTFTGNTEFGLRVFSAGEINANNLTASNNTITGAALYNFAGTGGDVNLTGINTFNNNDDGSGNGYGLGIQSNGTISLNNITANNNAQFGMYLENNFPGATGSIIVSGVNIFNNNGMGGVNAVSPGNIIIENVTANDNVGAGLSLGTVNGNIEITCGTFNNNTGYGLGANIPNVLTLNGVVFNGNTSGEMDLYGAGTLVENPFDCASTEIKTSHNHGAIKDSLSMQLVHVNSGDSTEFNCELFTGTAIVLSNGDKITFKCPISGSVSLAVLINDALPGELPEGLEYLSGVQAIQSSNGSNKALDGQVIVSFLVPKELQGENFAILYWDGNNWLDLNSATFTDGREVFNGGHLTGDGYFEAVTNFSGSFVLVKK